MPVTKSAAKGLQLCYLSTSLAAGSVTDIGVSATLFVNRTFLQSLSYMRLRPALAVMLVQCMPC